MKKIFLLWAIVIAVILSACSSEDYKSYVPADSKVIAKVDLKTFISQTGVDQEKLFSDIVAQLGDDAADLKNSGIDLTMPFYIFARNNGSQVVVGMLAKVSDREMAQKFYAKNSKTELTNGADYSYSIEPNVAVAINDEVVMVVSNEGGDKTAMEHTLTRVMKKDFGGDLSSNKVFARADGSASFASLCADLSIIPDEVMSAASNAGMKSEELNEMRSMTITLDGTATDGVCDFICSAESSNKTVQERIDKSNKAFGKISEKAFSSFSSGDVMGFAFNADGQQLAQLIKEAVERSASDDVKQMLGSTIDQVAGILGKIKGNVVGVFNSPQDFIVKAEGKNIVPDIVNSINESGMGGAFGLQSTSNGYSIGGQAWFGYDSGNFYVTFNENTAAQPSKVLGGPAPTALTNLMKSRKIVIYGSLDKIKELASATGDNSRNIKAFQAIFDKVKYVTFSYK